MIRLELLLLLVALFAALVWFFTSKRFVNWLNELVSKEKTAQDVVLNSKQVNQDKISVEKHLSQQEKKIQEDRKKLFSI